MLGVVRRIVLGGIEMATTDELKMMYNVLSQSVMVQRDDAGKLSQVAAGAALMAIKLCSEYGLDARGCSLEVAYWMHRIMRGDDIMSELPHGDVKESGGRGKLVRGNGMDYTAKDVIHKVIDPLFLNDLKAELEDIKRESDPLRRVERLTEYQDKLSRLNFLDPACGGGNFLVEAYISLRELENEVIRDGNNIGGMQASVQR